MPIHEAVHEDLFVGHVHLLGGVGGPELDAAAILAREGHGVGEHVVQLGERCPREAAHPVGPLGLDALEDRFALEHREVAMQFGVIAQQRRVLVLFGARMLDDAELEMHARGRVQAPCQWCCCPGGRGNQRRETRARRGRWVERIARCEARTPRRRRQRWRCGRGIGVVNWASAWTGQCNEARAGRKQDLASPEHAEK